MSVGDDKKVFAAEEISAMVLTNLLKVLMARVKGLFEAVDLDWEAMHVVHQFLKENLTWSEWVCMAGESKLYAKLAKDMLWK